VTAAVAVDRLEDDFFLVLLAGCSVAVSTGTGAGAAAAAAAADRLDVLLLLAGCVVVVAVGDAVAADVRLEDFAFLMEDFCSVLASAFTSVFASAWTRDLEPLDRELLDDCFCSAGAGAAVSVAVSVAAAGDRLFLELRLAG